MRYRVINIGERWYPQVRRWYGLWVYITSDFTIAWSTRRGLRRFASIFETYSAEAAADRIAGHAAAAEEDAHTFEVQVYE